MKTTIEHFKSFSKVPRCSFDALKMRDFIADFAKSVGYSVKIDRVNNILCVKNSPLVCLQSHYDMVCLGDAPNVECFEQGGWLRAKNSTLGADNGVGVALMLSMMERYDDVECLFTSDEEVGLIGANELEHEISAPYLLNLDSEEEGAIFIGCAGGADIVAKMSADKKPVSEGWAAYEVSVKELEGGHSGVDIDKNIPNAIKVLADTLSSNECEIVSINGGERINSIPKSASALVLAPKSFTPKSSLVELKRVQGGDDVLAHSKAIIDMIKSFAQGVRSFNDELNIPNDSINLSIVTTKADEVSVEFFARSMDRASLEDLCEDTKEFLEGFGFAVSVENLSSPWKPNITPFALKLQKIAQKFFENVEFKAIHAGLECGVFENRQSSLQVASVGPNIHFPHSLRECCEVSSVQ
ncbi:MAG: M20/M25/M40 family metallo-hydrolase, partial [Campylobacteraceae bacterium]|nr:M20/M25/M40 family metallo-hydrolase [Campylobacteraceae bacterium]